MTAGPHDLTGAYAVGAVSAGERAAFERHLDTCPACAREVRDLQAAAARLGAAAATPPPALWDRVLGEVRAGRRGAVTPKRIEGRVTQRDGTVAGLGRRRRVPPLLAAPALVAAVLAAPDARRVAARPGGTGQAAVVVSRERGRAVFVAGGLPPAPAARTYQLWVVDRSGPRPAGLVQVGAGGRVTRLLDGPVTGDERVAMTVERRGGATRPTSDPVVVVDLA